MHRPVSQHTVEYTWGYSTRINWIPLSDSLVEHEGGIRGLGTTLDVALRRTHERPARREVDADSLPLLYQDRFKAHLFQVRWIAHSLPDDCDVTPEFPFLDSILRAFVAPVANVKLHVQFGVLNVGVESDRCKFDVLACLDVEHTACVD